LLGHRPCRRAPAGGAEQLAHLSADRHDLVFGAALGGSCRSRRARSPKCGSPRLTLGLGLLALRIAIELQKGPFRPYGGRADRIGVRPLSIREAGPGRSSAAGRTTPRAVDKPKHPNAQNNGSAKSSLLADESSMAQHCVQNITLYISKI
jgi:hypothetical protein